ALDTIVTLQDVVFSGPATAIARDAQGHYYVAADDGILVKYGADGRLLRPVGRRGAGPGEYEMIRNVVIDTQGTVYVLDGVLGRLSRFTQDGECISSGATGVTSGLGMPAALLSGGLLVVNSWRRSAGDSAYTLQVVDLS